MNRTHSDSKEIKFSNLVDILRYRTKIHPEKVVYTFLSDGENAEITYTYNQLEQKSRAIAAKLQETIPKGERVLLLYEPGLDFISGFFACLYAGIIAVPAYPPEVERINKTLPRLLAIIKDCQPSLILTTSDILTLAESLSKTVPGLDKIKWQATDLIDSSFSDSYQDLFLDTNDIAFLQYTSGSTSTPKGVMVTHENLIYNEEMIKVCCKHDENSNFVGWLPLFHDMGLIGNVLQPLYIGSSCVMMSPLSFLKKPSRWLKAISKYRANTSGAPNFAYDLCTYKVTAEEKENLDLSSWKIAFNGAEPVRNHTLAKFIETFKSCGFSEKTFFPCYGLAEASLIISGTGRDRLPEYLNVEKSSLEKGNIIISESNTSRRLVSSGKAILDQKVKIVNPETMEECADNVIGEIWASGKNIAKGYWNKKDLSEYTFQSEIKDQAGEKHLRTGDLGFLHNEELYVTGRIKNLIIIRGRNLYPHDIELTMDNNRKSFPEIRLSCNAAFSVEKDDEEQLVIIQEIAPDKNKIFSAELLAQSLRKSILEKHEIIPYAVILVKAGNIPKTSSGKKMHFACKKAFLENYKEDISEIIYSSYNTVMTSENTQPKSKVSILSKADIEDWLSNWLKNELKLPVEKINNNTSFADFGLDSLLSVRLTGDLEEFTGTSLSKTILWDYKNINMLSSFLSGYERDKENIGNKSKKINLSEPIAIIGTGCRLPGGITSLNELWKVLHSGKNIFSPIPADRFDIDNYYSSDINETGKIYVREGGFLNDIDKFNPEFFGISPREAFSIDPQQRLLMEVTWEALENAGKNIEKLSGSNTGVFIGISGNDYSRFSINSGDTNLIDSYSGTGTAYSIASGRLSYILGLEGPAMSIDTACSSSLVAIHQACQSLRTNECDMAISGGVNIILSPEPIVYLCNIKALSPDGRCKSFDETANGYVRSEGCGIVILKRLYDAIENNDNILAIIRGSAINQDGKSNGLTAPNGLAQQKVIMKALADSGLNPEDISYIEAHGTGTSLGDPIEVNALKSVFGKNRKEPLIISSVKSNLGHLEAAAGVTGLLKVIASLQNKKIPGNLNLNKLNNSISLENSPLVITSENLEWKNDKYIAGLSSFGLSGTNAHMIIESSSIAETREKQTERPKHIFCISAKTENELYKLAVKFIDFLKGTKESIENICYSANTSKTLFNYRLAVVTVSVSDLIHYLTSFTEGKTDSNVFFSEVNSSREIAFIFSGQGSQYTGMGKKLYDTNPYFKQELEHCCNLFNKYLEKPLLSVIFDDSTGLINETAYTQPGLFAIEYSLASLLINWGIKPDLVMGHSIGEIVAACIAGNISLEDATKLVAARGKLMQGLPKNGNMFAIYSSENIVSEIIEPYKSDISIAAVNGPNNIVISGDNEVLNEVTAIFKDKNITFKELNVSHAFHSPLMEPILKKFSDIAGEITYSKPEIKLLSNLTGNIIDERNITNAEYWTRHILKPVFFSHSVEKICSDKNIYLLEIGPEPVLNAMIKKFKTDIPLFYTLGKAEDNWKSLLKNISGLYIFGTNIDWNNFDSGYIRKKVTLPTYDWDKKRYWPEHIRNKSGVEVSDTEVINVKKPVINSMSKESLESWLKNWISQQAGIRHDNITPETIFKNIGMDSVIIIILINDLEKLLGIRLNQSIINDYTDIKSLIDYLMRKLTNDNLQIKKD